MNGRNRILYPTLPKGEVVATFEGYPQAQEAVDVLARADFPVDKVSIVGSDLKSVERVTGKLTWGRVALAGAASGAWLGIFFGLLLIIFSPTVSLAFVLAALLIGAGFGMLWGIVSYAINRRRRDFTSVQQVIATSYSVLVDTELGNRARNLLGGGGAQQPPAPAAAPGWTPPAQPQHPSDPPPAPPAPPADAPQPPAPSADAPQPPAPPAGPQADDRPQAPSA
jgi:pyruvate/2-oxoglutarate dehydrogenase complex dihydrolipoamide acyltransferase (E2) component